MILRFYGEVGAKSINFGVIRIYIYIMFTDFYKEHK